MLFEEEDYQMCDNRGANLFDDIEKSTVLLGIFFVVITVPQCVRKRVFQWVEREESEVAVRHVLVLGA